MNRLRSIALATVAAHLVVSLVHGHAHTQLGVGLHTWQQLYVLVVITVAPLVGLILLWTKRSRWGFGLLTISMAGSLIFGGYHHYIGISPDHVSHLPSGDAQTMFRVTAALLLATELFGLIVGLFGLKRAGA